MMMPSTIGGRSPLFALSVSAGFVLVFIFGLMAWQSPSRMSFPHSHVDLYVHPACIGIAPAACFLAVTDNVTSGATPTQRPTFPLAKCCASSTTT